MSNVIHKKIEGCKDGALHKLMNNVAHAKTMENLRNRRDYLRCKQRKGLFKMGIETKPYVIQYIWQWSNQHT